MESAAPVIQLESSAKDKRNSQWVSVKINNSAWALLRASQLSSVKATLAATVSSCLTLLKVTNLNYRFKI